MRAGKVRYVGFSDTPAWKVAQAQTQALFRGWAPLIALQIEYSLIERTVEGELVPMALELGLGITPWSPLRGGVLSGKYTRENAGTMKADRGERVTNFLTERNYVIIDELIRIGRELACSPASVALAWLQAQPGVASTIIGARRLDQLDQNLAALDVTLDRGAHRVAEGGVRAGAELPRRHAEVRRHVHAGRADGEWSDRAGMAGGAGGGRGAGIRSWVLGLGSWGLGLES